MTEAVTPSRWWLRADRVLALGRALAAVDDSLDDDPVRFALSRCAGMR